MLISKIKDKSVKVGILGLGYVGLPLSLEFADNEVSVLGFDVDQFKIDKITNGETYIEHIPSSKIGKAVEKYFSATVDFSRISEVDAIIICVPTPLNKFREPDLSYVTKTMETISPYLRPNQILSLESTTYPGTTDEILKPYIDKTDLKVGENFFLVYSPEREDPGRKDYTTKTIPKVCGGYSEKCLDAGKKLYELVIDTVVPVSSTKAAEMTKILENIHRAVNIGLVNELKIVADKMDIDIFEVIKAAATKPFGFTPYFPGPGIGGHCIPIDPFYLTWKAREFDVHTRFIELAGEINGSMPDYVVSKCQLGLNKNKKSINGSNILVLGIAYKQNVDDMRESPSVFIMEKLRDLGANVQYSDPHAATFPKMREHSFDLKSVELNQDNLKSFDCVVLTTAHDKFDLNFVGDHSQLIIDTRGFYDPRKANVIRA